MSDAARDRKTMTEAEYLEFDAANDARHEFYNGEVVATAGAAPEHGAVALGLAAAIRRRLDASPCMAFVADQRVRVSETSLYAYPDLVIACAPIQFADTNPKTLLNPRVIVEVLSPSTEQLDRGPKFAHFQRRESVTEYVLVLPTERRIEHYLRHSDQEWLLTVTTGDGVLTLPTLGLEIPLSEIYADVERLPGLMGG